MAGVHAFLADKPTLAQANAKPHAPKKPRPRLLTKADARRQKQRADRALRAGVRARDGNQCQACHIPVFVTASNPLQRAQVHHIQFRSQGGPDTARNMVTVCAECHAKIHAHELDVLGTNALNVRFKKVKTRELPIGGDA